MRPFPSLRPFASLRLHHPASSLRAGRAGVLLINCLVGATAAGQGTQQQANTHHSSLQPLLDQYSAICASASHPGSGACDEVLYGRAGTLLGALLLRQKLGAHAVPDAAVTALARAMLTSGARAAGVQPWGVCSPRLLDKSCTHQYHPAGRPLLPQS